MTRNPTAFRVRLAQTVETFFLTPASPRPLAALRIGLSAILLVQVFLLRHEIVSFFAADGLVQGRLAEYLSEPGAPRLSWLTERLAPYGVSEWSCLFWATHLYCASLCFLLLGLFTRISAIAAWFLQWTFINTGYCNAYGFDMYAHIFLFYLMWAPAAGAWSLDLALGRVSGRASAEARVALRVMQVHIALAYLASAIEKASGAQWWNGEVIWRSLTMPEFRQFAMGWMAEVPWLARLLGWGALATEMLFCVFIWPKRTRKLWVTLTVSLHLGIAIFLGLQIFGAIMGILILSLFAVSPEPGPDDTAMSVSVPASLTEIGLNRTVV